MASSIHIAKGASGYLAHNSREQKTANAIFADEKNFCSLNTKEAFALYRAELAIRVQAYQNRTHQTLQKNSITHLSAIVNLEEHHTEHDLKKIVALLEKKFDTKVFQFVLHRDEGHIDDSGKVKKNKHGHLEFMGLDSEGASVRKKLTKKMLSELQTEVATELQMQRGVNYAKEKKKRPKRLDTYEFKASKQTEQVNRQELQKRLEDKYKKEREELKASGVATQKDYQALKLEFEKQKQELIQVKKQSETTKTLLENQHKILEHKLEQEQAKTAKANAEVVELGKYKKAYNNIAKALLELTKTTKIQEAYNVIKAKFTHTPEPKKEMTEYEKQVQESRDLIAAVDREIAQERNPYPSVFERLDKMYKTSEEITRELQDQYKKEQDNSRSYRRPF